MNMEWHYFIVVVLFAVMWVYGDSGSVDGLG